MKVDYYFEYRCLEVDSDVLEQVLSDLGAEGWRLHTCEPQTAFHGGTSGAINRVFIVMDRGPIYYEQEETANSGEEEIKDYSEVAGMPME